MKRTSNVLWWLQILMGLCTIAVLLFADYIFDLIGTLTWQNMTPLITIIVSLVGGGLAGGIANICYQEYRRRQAHKQRPILKLISYKHEAPYYRQTTETDNLGQNPRDAYYVNIPVRNIGHRVARRCEPMITAVGYRDTNGNWQRNVNWVPVGLKWAIVEGAERDLLAEPDADKREPRYVFNLLKISASDHDHFHLILTVGLYAQDWKYGRGEYRFRVTLYLEDGDRDEKWYEVHFTGSFGRAALNVAEMDRPPWE